MNLPLFIARKIYGAQGDKRKVSRPAIRIATVGVGIGLAVMLLSVSVVFGFKHTIRDKVIGFGSHIQVGDFMTIQGGEQYPIQMNDSMMDVLRKTPGVKHVQRFAVKQGILKTDSDFLGVAFKGVGPEFDSSFIHENMVEGSVPRFSDEAGRNKILVSKTMSDRLRMKVGDKVFAYFIDHNGVRARRFTVAGIYQTNLSAYDKVTCFTDLYTVRKLNGWEDDQASGAELTVNDFAKLQETEDILIEKVNRTIDQYGETYSSRTIREINPAIFKWLELLDLNGRGRRNDGLRPAHHHPGAHDDDRSAQGPGGAQPYDSPYFPLVRGLHYRQGAPPGRCHCPGADPASEIHGSREA